MNRDSAKSVTERLQGIQGAFVPVCRERCIWIAPWLTDRVCLQALEACQAW